eukprot:1148002-Pelagomonas_calceolata.AAC.1
MLFRVVGPKLIVLQLVWKQTCAWVCQALRRLSQWTAAFEDPTASQAARGRGRGRGSGTRKQACALSRDRGRRQGQGQGKACPGGAGAGTRQSVPWGAGSSATWRSQTQRKRPQRRRPWTQTEGLHEL